MTRARRKWDHIQFAVEAEENLSNGLSDVSFVHQSLPNLALKDIDLQHMVGELKLSSPIFINAMTGGGGERTTSINRELSILAKETGLAMAVGSQMAALKDSSEFESYQIVRKENPTGVLFANLGSEANVNQAKRAVDMIEANAIQIHLNVVQEITMPEGDRDFSDALFRIEKIVKNIQIPVIVKEVGFGMAKETVESLRSIGVAAVDIGGFGGTNFARIENKRRIVGLDFFNNWGIPTAASIVEAKQADISIPVIASGGITNCLDIAKSIALGADAVGIAGHFLKLLLEHGIEETIEHSKTIQEQLKCIMLALGARHIKDLQTVPLVISGKTHHWLNERGINTKTYSQKRM